MLEKRIEAQLSTREVVILVLLIKVKLSLKPN